MTDEELAELLFTDPPGPFIVKGNITPWGILNDDDIAIGTFDDMETARRMAVKAQKEGIEIFGMNVVFIAAWIEPQANPVPGPEPALS
jgi:hypothetical protein